MSGLDIYGNNKLNFSEFLAAMIDKKNMITKQNLYAAFRFIDKENEGYLNTSNVTKALSSVKLEATEEEVGVMLTDMSENGGRVITFNDFERLMTN